MKTIQLRGKYSHLSTQIDDSDWEYLSKFKWYLSSWGYVCRYVYVRNKSAKAVYMHKEIYLKHTEELPIKVDHRNLNKLDNRFQNLRKASHTQNIRNSFKHKDNTSGFKGVSWAKWANKWRVQIMVNGKRFHIGYFSTRKEAHNSYRKVSKQYHGEFARG